MDSSSPGELFDATFTPAVIAAIVEALGAAYNTACEHHVPEHGSNETTFGFNLYHHAVHELCKVVEDKAVEDDAVDDVAVLSRNPTFRLGVGEFALACHRVGGSDRENIWTSFPKNEGAACTMVEEQLWLPGYAQHLGIDKARKLILAHFGSAEDGFRAAYLCIPGKTERGRITAWIFVKPLWNAEQKQVELKPQPALPPAEVVEAPVVRRKAPMDASPVVVPPVTSTADEKDLSPVAAEKDVDVKVHRKESTADRKKVGDDEIG